MPSLHAEKTPVLYPAGLHPGTTVQVRVGPVMHVGIVSDRWDGDAPMVLEKSLQRGKATEVSWATFSGGGLVYLYPLESRVGGYQAVENARARIGEWWLPWDNCEHFVTTCHGLEARSPQGVAWGSALAGAALLLVAVRS